MIRFRPHHFLCALGYQGKGYSGRFVANMDAVVADGLHGPGGQLRMIEVVERSDDICAPCPHRRGDGCDKAAKIDGLDRRHAQRLDLHPGQIIAWAEVRGRIKTRIRPEDLDGICTGCEWLDTGMCKEAVEALRRE